MSEQKEAAEVYVENELGKMFEDAKKKDAVPVPALPAEQPAEPKKTEIPDDVLQKINDTIAQLSAKIQGFEEREKKLYEMLSRAKAQGKASISTETKPDERDNLKKLYPDLAEMGLV